MKNNSVSKLDWKERFTYVKNVPFDEDDLKCKGAKFQIVKFKPKTSIKPHYHKKTVEIFFIKSGNGILNLNGEKFRCKPDDFFLCEPGDVHEFINDVEEELVILIFKTNDVVDKDIYWSK